MTGADQPALDRARIVAAARALVAEAGLDALSLRRLATRLGVTAPALYAHVSGKQDLLAAVAEVELERLADRFEQVDRAHRDDPRARIRGHLRAYVDHARDEPELFATLFLFPPELAVGAGTDPLALPGATKVFRLAADAVAEAADAGTLRTDDPLLAALALWSAAHGLASVLRLGFDLPREVEDALVDELVDRLLAGYGMMG